MIRQLYMFRYMKDNILATIERISGRIHTWAWDKRFKKRDPNEWIKEYREWKKEKNEN